MNEVVELPRSKYSPSASSRWLNCTQSLILKKDEEKEERKSIYALKGTALHSASEHKLKDLPINSSYDDYVVTDQDLEEIVNPYVEYVKDIDADLRFYEVQVFVNENCYGTADAVLYNSKTGMLHVIDLKCGAGVFVPVTNNSQLKIYALGAMKKLVKMKKKISGVFVHVVQPLKDNMEREKLSIKSLLDFEKQINKTIDEVENGTGRFHVSDDTCRWCPHARTCPEIYNHVQKVAMNDFETEELKEKLDLIPSLKIFIKNTEEMAMEKLMAGETIESYKLKPGRKTRVWKSLEDARELLKHVLKEDDLFKMSFLSVAQIEKILKKKKIDFDMSKLIESKSTTVKISKI